MLKEAVSKKWTAGERALVVVLLIAGLLLVSSHPIWGVVLMLLSALCHVGGNMTHREEVMKQYPDLFGSLADPKKPS